MYKIETRWIATTVIIGKILQPACQIKGVLSCQHLNGGEAKEGEQVVCLIECDEATINAIVDQGLGTILP